MPSWNDLVSELESLPDDGARGVWVAQQLQGNLQGVGAARGGRNVILYGSAFLQKTAPPGLLQITHEEINGFMSVVYGMDCTKGLTLLLHTPGGVINAAETIVAYLWSKFTDIEVIVPTYAMSAGTMISLAANRIVMGRQSQLGPIDPQIPVGGSYISARSITDQFDRARADVLSDLHTAHVWAPVLQSLGPGLLQEAHNQLAYGEQMVSRWLEQRMLTGASDATLKAASAAKHFNDASIHKSHGRRIDRHEARDQNLVVLDLEDDQGLQEAVLTSYHVMTLLFEKSPACKILTSDAGSQWVKNV